jgi:endoglucanase
MPLSKNKIIRWLVPFLISIFTVIGISGHLHEVKAATNIKPPLSTKGSQIIDATGKTVLLRGVNWFGTETQDHIVHGLWARDYQEMLAQIKNLGYNVIRYPYSVNALRSNNINTVNYGLGNNKNLQGKTPLQALDIIIQEAHKQGLFIILDSHRLNDYNIPELWYGDGLTEADWINTWVMLAQRYKNQPNVIGADLKNEPHGRASWGTNDPATDWRLAAERAGNAILKVNPHWLILVEGLEKNVPNQKLDGYCWGGNLEGVKSYPVRLSVPNKVVYSPHDYGPEICNHSAFNSNNFPNSLISRWDTAFNYINTQNIAPVLIGEFGGKYTDTQSKSGIWQRKIIDFIAQKKLSFTYWSWNPNSGDTGGILKDDWRSIDQNKQQLLNKLLGSKNIVSGGNSPPIFTTKNPQPKRTTPKISAQISKGNLNIKALIQSDSATNFCVKFMVTNKNLNVVNNWQIKFTMNQAKINNSWNGQFNRQGKNYIVNPPNWAKILTTGKTIDSIGFCATKQGKDYQLKAISAKII